MIALTVTAFLLAGCYLVRDADARTLQQRITWLQHRLAHHQGYVRFIENHHLLERNGCGQELAARPPNEQVCRRLERIYRFEHAAVAWTRRELTEARSEAYHRLETSDWVVATMLADRVYPGTRAWLLSCSSGEGGHGRFVWNTIGSGSGGWMQFLHSTYNAYVASARAETRRRHFWVSERRWSYFEPLGQALTAAYMRSHGMSRHWDPNIDRLCA